MAEEIKSLEELGGNSEETVSSDAPVYVQKLDAQGRAYATGKRKDAVARVWVKPGSGKIIINKKITTPSIHNNSRGALYEP